MGLTVGSPQWGLCPVRGDISSLCRMGASEAVSEPGGDRHQSPGLLGPGLGPPACEEVYSCVGARLWGLLQRPKWTEAACPVWAVSVTLNSGQAPMGAGPCRVLGPPTPRPLMF